jgi:TatD DNase family protein
VGEIQLVDAHCHLDELERRGMAAAEAVAAAAEAGVVQMVTSGDSPAENQRARELAEEFPEVFFTPGWHPSNGRAPSSEERREIGDLLAHPRAVALGEVGLDYHRRDEGAVWDPREQRHLLRSMLELAAEVGKPVVIHQRDAGGDLLEVLDLCPRVPTMLHCFSGGAKFARAAVSRGLFCSFAGNLTFGSAAQLREAAQVVPPELLLLETDSPFLAPHPLRGRLCHPALVRLTASWLASHLGVGLQTVAEWTSSTARAFFQLPPP